MPEYVPGGWRAQGACVSADPELFFPISPQGKGAGQVARARQVCGACPVRRECLDFAMTTHETEGIWGGTTPQERARDRRATTGRRRRQRRLEPAASAA